MQFDNLFPSKYLKAADFQQARNLTIKGIAVEEIGQDHEKKPVLFFNELTQGMVLNKTNGGLIAHSFGNNTDDWLGKQVELRKEPVAFQGKVVDSIRLRPVEAPFEGADFQDEDVSF